MATTVFIPVEEYLRTSYRPDCDYVDGEVEERNLGEQWHAAVQTTLAIIFGQNRHAWGLRPLTEQRVQVLPTRFRIPDVCVVQASDPFTGILRKAPVLCVEVLSPEDRFSRIVERAEEYRAMGVRSVWIIDPRTRDVWTMTDADRPAAFTGEALTLPDTPVRIPVHEIFALIDEAPPAAEDESPR